MGSKWTIDSPPFVSEPEIRRPALKHPRLVHQIHRKGVSFSLSRHLHPPWYSRLDVYLLKVSL
jgi:hypothetical protein